MRNKYLQVLISAENKTQANLIMGTLLKKKLIIGGLIIEAPAQFWWKGEIIKMKYSNILTFTSSNHRERVITEVEKVSKEEIPMVAFSPVTANNKFLDWIEHTVH